MKEAKKEKSRQEFKTVMVEIKDIKNHPENYCSHPPDEIEHIKESIRSNGVYKNIVISSDGYILAGHGVVQALSELGEKNVPAYRIQYTFQEQRAMRLLVGDNEISHLRFVDNRKLSEILKETIDKNNDLLGTGYTKEMLSALVFATRPEIEIPTMEEAAEYSGIVGYDPGDDDLACIVRFRTQEDRDSFVSLLIEKDDRYKKIEGLKKRKKSISTWYPFKEEEDLISLKVNNKK